MYHLVVKKAHVSALVGNSPSDSSVPFLFLRQFLHLLYTFTHPKAIRDVD